MTAIHAKQASETNKRVKLEELLTERQFISILINWKH